VRILQVIHGYPMRYNAGSEVYTQTLSRGLAARHEVHVFTREEDTFAPDHGLRREADAGDPRVTLHVVNNPRSRDRYRHEDVDRRFVEVLDAVRPDVIHIGHLNHLSTSLVFAAAAREIPVACTLHDYWLMCPRGQFLQMNPAYREDIWPSCDGQEDRKCAERCYARYFSGAHDERETDVAYWSDWVGRRMRHVRDAVERIDLFIAPVGYLHRRFRDDFGLPERKLVELDYGFDRKRLAGRAREVGEPFTFGYIGTHIPAKGIHLLLEAFGNVPAPARLRIWGRPNGQETAALHGMARRLPNGAADRVEFLAEYRNEELVPKVLNRADCIVVPSIWVENSPLVIHEALQARVPVITANAGGMAELVRHEVNGLLFEHRNQDDLARQLQRMAADPELARRLGRRGFLGSETGDVPGIDDHVAAVEGLYATLITRRDSARVAPRSAPWRITFETNPDACNLRCIMCERQAWPTSGRAASQQGTPTPRVMPFDLIRRGVAEAAPCGLREVIPSTMGEPLLYERMDDFIDLCAEHGVRLNLTTNGTFPGRGARAWAERIVPVASDVKISWNGAKAATLERIMVGVRWEEAIESLRSFVAVRDRVAAASGRRCRVTLQTTFLETNVFELPALVRLAASLGVDRLKGHHVWAHTPALRALSMRRDASAVRRWNAVVEQTVAAAHDNPLPGGGQVLLENIHPLDESAPEDLAPGGPCPFLGQEAWVSAEGLFDPCCAPDALRRSLGDFGNVNDQGLLAIWNGRTYRELVKTYRTRALCIGCNMRKPAEVR
jgi:glycosyltransferase involved in cell wall biosynthesis/MoaA/NifB/PqqE/SkfB family radical SAM enzyme